MNARICKMCKRSLKGRSDKIFCSIACKSEYHIKLHKANAVVTKRIDHLLHRNRAILLELMGKQSGQKKVARIVLEKKKFNFKYLTHFYVNSRGKMYHYVYDFAWVEFSTDEVLIVRRKR